MGYCSNMAPLTNEDKILIKTLRLEKGWSVLRMTRELLPDIRRLSNDTVLELQIK